MAVLFFPNEFVFEQNKKCHTISKYELAKIHHKIRWQSIDKLLSDEIFAADKGEYVQLSCQLCRLEGGLLSQTGVEFSSWKWKSAFCTSSTLCMCDIPSGSQAALNRWQERQQILIPEHIEVLEHDIYTINAWVLTLERQSVSGMIQMMTILVIHDLNPNGASSINSQISNLGKNCLNCPVST